MAESFRNSLGGLGFIASEVARSTHSGCLVRRRARTRATSAPGSRRWPAGR